jgi:hypothetical protein
MTEYGFPVFTLCSVVLDLLPLTQDVSGTQHPCFNGADLTRLSTLVQHQATAGQMSTHGTHIASLIFGQPKTEIEGIAPNCRGLLVRFFVTCYGSIGGHKSTKSLSGKRFN